MQITLERQSKTIALSFNTDNSIAYDELYLAVQDKMSAIVNGGKFFVGKAFTIVGNAVSVLSKNIYVQGLTVAAAGGLGSRLAGGSFELGFLTAGLAFAVNQVVTQLAQERQAGNVYVTGHKVGGVGPVDTAVEYTDENGRTTVISAGSKDGLLYSEADQDGYSDAPAGNFTVDLVNTPDGTTSTQYVQRLLRADSNYSDNVDYDLFPGVQDSYNSNSYLRGLIQATGGSTSVDLGGYVGGSKPLPACHFSTAGC